MKAFFKELFQYNLDTNQQLIGLLVTHKDKLTEKSIRLMSHIINAHHVWNSRIVMTNQQFAGWDLHAAEALAGIDASNNEISMKIIEQENFDRVIAYTNSLGNAYQNSVRDILFHQVNHATYHRGQIAAECRQAGVEPLSTDYIMYKR